MNILSFPVHEIRNDNREIAAEHASDARKDAAQLKLSVEVAFQDVLDACGMLKRAEDALNVAHRRYMEQRRQLETAEMLLGVNRG